jgi:ArsR family transcriptional regulator, lead/cadmium/zinc/bismuth-responsive transcriptional repressor
MTAPSSPSDPCLPSDGAALPDPPPDALVAATVRLLKGFADGTRLRLLWLLRHDEVCVHVLVDALGMSQSAVSHQLRLLRDARLVAARRSGRHVYYRLADEHVRALLENAVSHGDEVT